jgi:hypothetical protein
VSYIEDKEGHMIRIIRKRTELEEYREKLEIRKTLYDNRSSCGNHTKPDPQDEQYTPIDIRTENNSIRIKELIK